MLATDTLADRILARRQSLGLTQAEAARRAGIAQSYWQELESGKKDSPSITVIKKISVALQVSPGKLL